MAAGRIELAVQIITALSIIVGIVLVTFELRQARVLARATIAPQAAGLAADRAHAAFGEQMADTLVRACFEPQTMTKADSIRLNEYFRSISMVVATYAVPATVASLDTPWQAMARYPYGIIAGYPGGREWLRRYAERESGERSEVLRSVAEDESIPGCHYEIEPLLATQE